MEPSAAVTPPLNPQSDPIASVSQQQQQQPAQQGQTPPKRRRRRKTKTGEWEPSDDEPKRRVVSTACVACRKRKSKCDGNTPACAACSQVYNTRCVYDPNSDHRRKGVYRQDGESLKTRESTLNTIVQAILHYPEDEVPALVRRIRASDNLDKLADDIASEESSAPTKQESDDEDEDFDELNEPVGPPSFESQLGSKMGELRIDDGSVRYIGGTSHLLFLNSRSPSNEPSSPDPQVQQQFQQPEDAISSWTTVTQDRELITHLLNLYFTWHYTYFTCMSRPLFYRSFLAGRKAVSQSQHPRYCSSLLVNAMLAVGCHFTSRPAARADPFDHATAGDHFFREAKRLILENDEHEKPRITTVQALAIMSVREAGCGREARGWVYSGMSFRMAGDMGLHLDSSALAAAGDGPQDPNEEDVRRITFWGCFLFDKCWSNYLGRLPQLPRGQITCPKFDVFPNEDAAEWVPYSDVGPGAAHRQPARTRAIALHISTLCEVNSDLMRFFYNPGAPSDAAHGRGKQAELKKLSEIEIRLQLWRKDLPKELEPRDGALPGIFIMHMFFQLSFIHLFRPFLKYTASTSPLPPTVSPRKVCTTAATAISRLARLYKRTYGLRQVCNICIYMVHTACTIHLLNLPDRDARRDIVHGVRQLEEMAESWLSAKRTLGILKMLARQWHVDLPPDAAAVLERCGQKFGDTKTHHSVSPPLKVDGEMFPPPPAKVLQPSQQQHQQQSSQPQIPLHPEQIPAMEQSTSQSQAWQYDTSFQLPDQNQIQQANSFPSQHQILEAQKDPSRLFGGVDQLLQSVGGARPNINNGVPSTTLDIHGSNYSYAPQACTQATSTNFQGTAAGEFTFDPSQAQSVDWSLADQRDLAWGLGNWAYSGPGTVASGGTPGSTADEVASAMEGWDVGFDMGYGDGGAVGGFSGEFGQSGAGARFQQGDYSHNQDQDQAQDQSGGYGAPQLGQGKFATSAYGATMDVQR